jgi:hypothetical protein
MVIINTMMEKYRSKKNSPLHAGWGYFVCMKLIRWVFLGAILLAMYTLILLYYMR